MDFIFIKSSKKGKEDFGSIYARVRTGKANMKIVTGFAIKQLEWEKYRSLQYTSSALMLEKPLNFAPFGHAELSLLAKIWLTPLAKIVLPTCFTYNYSFFV